MENRTFNPLVSIVVITYKSSATVIETLESIKAQTYRNIELFISDDCSPDNTAEICRDWLSDNAHRFINSGLITSTVNTGISENSKRGIEKCTGEWLKTIAGDDLLIPTAIEDYISFVISQSEEVMICMSDVELFSDKGNVPDNKKKVYERFFKLANQPYKQQLLHSLQENIFVGPGVMIRIDLSKRIKQLSVNYGNADEWPFFYDVLTSGFRIYAIDKKLIRYRVSSESLSQKIDDKGMKNTNLILSVCKFFFDYPFKDLLKRHSYFIAWDRYLHYKTLQLYYTKGGSRFYSLLCNYALFLSPYAYYRKLLGYLKSD